MSAVSPGSKFPKSWCASSRFSLHCFFLDFPLVFLLSFCRWWRLFLDKQKQKQNIYGKNTRRKVNMGAKTLGGITKVIKSYEGDQFSKISFKGRGEAYFTMLSPKSFDYPPPQPPQVINNDWSLTETFPRSMINKLLPQEPITGRTNLGSGSIFVSLWNLIHSGGQGETKREPDTNLLRNVCRPVFWLIDICRISQPKLLPLIVFLVRMQIFSAWGKYRLADLKKSFYQLVFFLFLDSLS